MQDNREPKAQKIYKIILMIILTAFITFMITSLSMYNYFTKNPIVALINSEKGTELNLDYSIQKIRQIIDKNYLWKDEIDEQKLVDGAVQGYVKAIGDKYTEYIPKENMERYKEDLVGSYTGIGMYLIADEEKERVIVYYPIPESPAEKAGIKPGDVVISVNDVEYTDKNLNEVSSSIKGEEGTKVKLKLEREGKELEFEVIRQKIEMNPITSKILENNIGYISFASFDMDTSKVFKEKMDELVSKGAKSLILDLRNNGGGIVDESTNIADLFLEKGKTIITTKDNKGNEETTKTNSKQIYDLPLVILTNENTASASEILTGALKENGRAKAIGTKTYGKGVIQQVITLSDGSGLRITIAEYYTPKGTEINKKGISPDIEVKLPTTVKNEFDLKENEDTQLKKAIEILK